MKRTTYTTKATKRTTGTTRGSKGSKGTRTGKGYTVRGYTTGTTGTTGTATPSSASRQMLIYTLYNEGAKTIDSFLGSIPVSTPLTRGNVYGLWRNFVTSTISNMSPKKVEMLGSLLFTSCACTPCSWTGSQKFISSGAVNKAYRTNGIHSVQRGTVVC